MSLFLFISISIFTFTYGSSIQAEKLHAQLNGAIQCKCDAEAKLNETKQWKPFKQTFERHAFM